MTLAAVGVAAANAIPKRMPCLIVKLSVAHPVQDARAAVDDMDHDGEVEPISDCTIFKCMCCSIIKVGCLTLYKMLVLSMELNQSPIAPSSSF